MTQQAVLSLTFSTVKLYCVHVCALLPRLDSRLVQLELQLQTLEQQKCEAAEKLAEAEQSAATLRLQLQTEAEQKLEAVEKVGMLELAVADLERRVGEEGNSDVQVCSTHTHFMIGVSKPLEPC